MGRDFQRAFNAGTAPFQLSFGIFAYSRPMLSTVHRSPAARSTSPRFQRVPSSTLAPAETRVENVDFVNLSSAAASASPSRWKGLMKTAGIALMLGLTMLGPIGCTAPPSLPQQTTAIERVIEAPAPPKPQEQREIVADYQAQRPAQLTIQKLEGRPTTGIRYQYTRAELDAASRNTVSGAELKPGDLRFTAHGVDSGQASKQYHQSGSLTVLDDGAQISNSTDSFTMCANINKGGENCAGGFPNKIQHSTLSCIYRNEADGGLYRVVHQSHHHYQTNAMQKNVCGGHELRSSDGAWMPYQTGTDGSPLYLNPANILQVQALTGAEMARFPG